MAANRWVNSRKTYFVMITMLMLSSLKVSSNVVVFSEKEILESTAQGQGTLNDINKFEDKIIAIIEQERQRVLESEQEIDQLQRDYDERQARMIASGAVLTVDQKKALSEEARALQFARSELAVLQQQFYHNVELAQRKINERYVSATSEFYKKVFQKYSPMYGWDIALSLNSSDMVLFGREAINVTNVILKSLKKQADIQSQKFTTVEEVKKLFADLGLVYLDSNKVPAMLNSAIDHSIKEYYQEHSNTLDQYLRVYGEAIAQKRRAPIYVAWVSDKVGWGVFAAQDISDGDLVQEYTGVVAERRPGIPFDSTYAWQLYQPRDAYLLLIDSKVEGNEMRFVNHSNHPNLRAKIFIGIDKQYHVAYIAQGFIKAGEQLLVSYGQEYWKDRDYFQELFD